jgi:poly-gamma-glutamate capsule biosynthesis protein CapA/YwtB (metallophosphatase superfamily)
MRRKQVHKAGLIPMVLLVTALPGLAGCSDPPDCPILPAEPHARFSITVTVQDEGGDVISAASVDIGDRVLQTGANGSVQIDNLDGPVVAVVSAPGHLSEPFPLGLADAGQSVKLRLLSDNGGKRWVMSSVGDVMFGRRYQEPWSGDPLIPVTAASSGSEHVVAAVARAFSAADFRTVNLETVVSHLPHEAAYPGKRFILKSPPEAIAGLKALGVDAIGLANNHARDYLEPGIEQTLQALSAAKIPFVGASAGPAGADVPVISDVRGTRVGMLAWTTVEGSIVNSSYPPDDAVSPSSLDPDESWQYSFRKWFFMGQDWTVPSESRRLGGAWLLYSNAEDTLSETDRAGGWTSMSKVYPEMQDWAARRGHGGAALWDEATAVAKIQALSAQVDVIVVQVHAGFQFVEAPSVNVKKLARAAIDAGADIVICHHPHVLQGLEWYKGKLIAYSLGNFIFDQDFLNTFSSVILRTVWEGDTMLEARLLPVELLGYRPMVASDAAARRTLFRIWERSVLGAEADRYPDSSVRTFPAAPNTDPNTSEAHIVIADRVARIVPTPAALAQVTVTAAPGTAVPIDFDGLVESTLGLAPGEDEGILIGRDLFGWGHFNDNLTDGVAANDAHWVIEGCPAHKRTMLDPQQPGEGFLQLLRKSTNESRVQVRPVARVTLTRHHLFDAQSNPLDPEPTYSFKCRARLLGDAQPSIRLDLYHFDDTDPTEDPTSVLVERLEIPFTVPPGDDWQDIEVVLPQEPFAPGDAPANMAMMYLRLDPARQGEATLDLDDVALMQWRPASAMPDRFGHYTHVRNEGTAARSLVFSGLPATGP